jgi:hypothetical protein
MPIGRLRNLKFEIERGLRHEFQGRRLDGHAPAGLLVVGFLGISTGSPSRVLPAVQGRVNPDRPPPAQVVKTIRHWPARAPVFHNRAA